MVDGCSEKFVGAADDGVVLDGLEEVLLIQRRGGLAVALGLVGRG
jgi:hypothetical protein